MKLKQLEIALQEVEVFETPKVQNLNTPSACTVFESPPWLWKKVGTIVRDTGSYDVLGYRSAMLVQIGRH